jgi:uncharacterized protein (DUF58 family)
VVLVYLTVLGLAVNAVVDSPYLAIAVYALILSIIASYAEARASLRYLREVRVARKAPSYAVEGSLVHVDVEVQLPRQVGRLIVVYEEPFTRQISSSWQPVIVKAERSTYRYSVALGIGLNMSRTLVVEYPSFLGAFRAVATIQAPLVVHVYPATVRLRELGHYYAGEATSTATGVGVELKWLREWVPGDDPRRIAWRATARLGRPIVREDLAELGLDVLIVLDLSKPMWSGRPGSTAADRAARVALSIAYMVYRLGGRLGYLLLTGSGLSSEAPQPAAMVFEKLARDIAGVDVNQVSTLPPQIRREVLRRVQHVNPSTLIILIPSRYTCELALELVSRGLRTTVIDAAETCKTLGVPQSWLERLRGLSLA